MSPRFEIGMHRKRCPKFFFSGDKIGAVRRSKPNKAQTSAKKFNKADEPSYRRPDRAVEDAEFNRIPMELREGCSTKIKVCGVLPPYNACGDCAQKNRGPPSQTFVDADLVATACLKQPAPYYASIQEA